MSPGPDGWTPEESAALAAAGYVPLAGSRLDSPPVAVCGRCGRSSWDACEVGEWDTMPQPDGGPCGGVFVAVARAVVVACTGCGVTGHLWQRGDVHEERLPYVGLCGGRYEVVPPT